MLHRILERSGSSKYTRQQGELLLNSVLLLQLATRLVSHSHSVWMYRQKNATQCDEMLLLFKSEPWLLYHCHRGRVHTPVVPELW